MTPSITTPLRSSVDDLWQWHASHDLDHRAPPWLVTRADDRHKVDAAANNPLYLEIQFSREQHVNLCDQFAQMFGPSSNFVEHRETEARMADRLDAIGRHRDADKAHTCRHGANLYMREMEGKVIPHYDAKCKHARFCPDEAREEAKRVMQRDVPEAQAWLKQDRRHRLFFITLSPPPVPPDYLKWAMRELFAVFDAWRRSTVGRGIELARAAVETPLLQGGRWHPHLHGLIGAAGGFDFDPQRAVINDRLRKRIPLVEGDVLQRLATGEVLRVDAVQWPPMETGLTPVGKKGDRQKLDTTSLIATLSDGTQMPVNEILDQLKAGQLTWAYKLKPTASVNDGAKVQRVVAVDHDDPAGTVVELESGAGQDKTRVRRRVSDVGAQVARGVLTWPAVPMSFQIDFKPVGYKGGQQPGRPSEEELTKAYLEVTKYMLKFRGGTAAGTWSPPASAVAGASYGTWSAGPPGLLELPDAALLEWCEAGDNFRRSRAYGVLHGVKRDKGQEDAPRLIPLGRMEYDARQRDCRVKMSGQTHWGQALERQRQARVDLIPFDKSAEYQALESVAYKANKSATSGTGEGRSGGERGPPGQDFNDRIPF